MLRLRLPLFRFRVVDGVEDRRDADADERRQHRHANDNHCCDILGGEKNQAQCDCYGHSVRYCKRVSHGTLLSRKEPAGVRVNPYELCSIFIITNLYCFVKYLLVSPLFYRDYSYLISLNSYL